MARWTGVWIGVWDGGEASEPGVLNAALNVAGSGAGTFGAELVEAPAQGGVGRLIYSSLLSRTATPVPASLAVVGAGSAQFAPALGQAVEAAMVATGRSGAQLGAGLAVAASLSVSARAGAALAPGLAVQAALAAAGEGVAAFEASSTTRAIVVPLRPRVELSEDEEAAILLLLAA